MGLKEAGLRGSLRNVSTGVPAIPDSEVYLHDDWGDNKLQDREDSGTTTHNGVEGVYRPEWSQVGTESLPSVANETLTVGGDEYMTSPINLNLSETVTWDLSNVGISGEKQLGFALFGGTSTVVTGDEFNVGAIYEGYNIGMRVGENVEIYLGETDASGNTTIIAQDDDVAWPADVSITRDPSGNWELIVDGVVSDTATDSTWTDAQNVAFGGRTGSNDNTIDELKIS